MLLYRCNELNTKLNSMQHSPTWEADIPPHFMEPEVSLQLRQAPATCPYSNAVHESHSTSRRSILILSPYLHLCLLKWLLRSGAHTKPRMYFFSPPYMPHALPIQFFLIWSPEWCLVSSTERKAPNYVVFSTSLLPRPSLAQILSSAPNSQARTAYVPSSMWATKFHTHEKQQAKLRLCLY